MPAAKAAASSLSRLVKCLKRVRRLTPVGSARSSMVASRRLVSTYLRAEARTWSTTALRLASPSAADACSAMRGAYPMPRLTLNSAVGNTAWCHNERCRVPDRHIRTEPIVDGDEAIADALASTSVSALVASVVQITGDPSYLRGPIRPREFIQNEFQGKLTDDEKAQLRRDALKAICVWRD